MIPNVIWPQNKAFAFSIFDDTDVATLAYIRPIYDFLHELGMRTTKSVWSLDTMEHSPFKGSHTLQYDAYADYIQTLKRRGFEIGFHGAKMVSSHRPETIKAFERFRDVVGHYPKIYAPHANNIENLYWGESRFTIPFFRRLYRFAFRGRRLDYKGHNGSSPYFWGDLAEKHIKYVRNFTFNHIDLRRVFPMLFYHNKRQPLVRYWFISADADNVEAFNRILQEKNQAELVRRRGVCIISTHFGKGFIRNGRIHPTTAYLLKRLKRNNGWFAPVSEILDYMGNSEEIGTDEREIRFPQLFRMESAWFLQAWWRSRHRLVYEKTELPYIDQAEKGTGKDTTREKPEGRPKAGNT